MTHIYVVAGTFDQAKEYISKKRFDYLNSGEPPLLMPNYLYVSVPQHLKGIRNPTGVLIGTWRERPDIIEILETLMLASDVPNKALVAAYDELMTKYRPIPKKRPTPKLKPDDVVQAAAELLAKEIDAEVLKQMMGKVPPLNPIFDTIMKDPSVWTMLPKKP